MTRWERECIATMHNAGARYRDIAIKLDRPIGTISFVISNLILEGLVTRRRERDDARKPDPDVATALRPWRVRR